MTDVASEAIEEDPDAAKFVENSLRLDGVIFAYNVNYKGVESRGGKPPITVMIEDNQGERSLEFDALLIATGRKPTVKGLGLEDAGIEIEEEPEEDEIERFREFLEDVFAAERY